ncbi:ABC transporter ATP-binding protein [Actinomyces qiguomingii]|uniref:ABC transporter ATP-binding protein n=1 Tax=Actinomyces qiguomingii TaxID=2057800 RepID=UPI000CA070DA|nr:ATP-binding cassette domain-containing protein [Actinomyces qiguomingii]
MTMLELSLNEVSVCARSKILVENVTRRMVSGDCLLLCGSNGSGKTTLLRLLAFHIVATGGEYVLSRDGYSLLPHEAKGLIGAQVGEPVFLPGATPLSTLSMQAAMFSVPDDSGRMLSAFGLSTLAEQPCSSLSKGEQKRLALARALCTGPELLLLDEPEGGLDECSSDVLAGMLAGSIEGGAMCVIATHDPARYAFLQPETLDM